MSIIETLLQEPKKAKKPLGVCIPDHARQGHIKKKKITDSDASCEGAFLVNGIYELFKEITITGEAISGKITLSSQLIYKESLVPIKELLVQGSKVEELKSGEKGAIVLQTESYTRISSGEILDFE